MAVFDRVEGEQTFSIISGCEFEDQVAASSS